MKRYFLASKESDGYKFVAYSGDYVDFSGVMVRFDIESLVLDRFKSNPILLWQHDAGMPIGTVDMQKVDGKLIAELTFDEADYQSRWAKGKVDSGTVKAVSIGVDVTENSEVISEVDETGTERITIRKAELLELSLCSIPRDRNALRFSLSDSDIFEMNHNVILELEKKTIKLNADLDKAETKSQKPVEIPAEPKEDYKVKYFELGVIFVRLSDDFEEMQTQKSELEKTAIKLSDDIKAKDAAIASLSTQIESLSKRVSKLSVGLQTKESVKKPNEFWY
jgi:HK97 family phage prohead protease